MFDRIKEGLRLTWVRLLALVSGAFLGLYLLARLAGYSRRAPAPLPPGPLTSDGRAETERRRLESEAQAEAAKAEAAKAEIRAADAAHVAAEWNRLRKD